MPVLCVVLALGAAYLTGARRLRQSGEAWPWRRAAAFCGGGLGALVLATMSFLGVYDQVLFSVRAAQTVLLLLVVPLFLTLGRPLTLLGAAVPRAGRRVERVLASRAARILTFPALTAFVLVVMPFLLYFTPWYEAGLSSAVVGDLTRFTLTLPGLVFFWTLLRVDPVPKAYPYVVSLWVSGVEVIGDAVLGLAVLADPNLIAGAYYHALARPWGPSVRADQVIGGGVLWILGDIVGVPFFAAQLIQMMREDEQEAVLVDAELDALTPPVAGRPPAQGPGPAQQPWWQSDPRFTGRFRGSSG